MRILLIAVLALGVTACGSFGSQLHAESPAPGVSLAPQEADGDAAAEPEAAAETAKETPKEESRGVLTHVLLYLPNRVIDLFDVAKVGVDVGPGLGIELKATEYVQAIATTSVAVGIGFQSLRHLPFRIGPEAGFGLGPLGGTAEMGGWYRSSTEFRVGLYAFLVGAHASVDPVEVVDFVLGFFFIDIKDDDL